MSKSFKLAVVIDPVLGWKTSYQNWQQHFPQDMDVEPTWILLSHERVVWIEKVPGLPFRLKGFLRNLLMLREGLKKGPFDATLIAANSAQMTLTRYMKRNACFLYLDATPEQLYDFGDFYGWHRSPNPRLRRLKHRKRAFAYRQARGVFGMSRWTLDSVVADYGASPEKMHVLPPAVDLTRWQPGDSAQKADKGVCDLLFVGGDFARKGGPLLLDWAAQTAQSGWRLHLVTPQPVETDDPRVCVYNDLTSNDPRLQALYRQADVFVLPTLADCSPWAGIEALASGLPLVITATGGTAEIVQPGRTGYLLPQRDASALAQSLDTLIGDPALRARMGASARLDAEQRFNAPMLVREAVQIMMNEA